MSVSDPSSRTTRQPHGDTSRDAAPRIRVLITKIGLDGHDRGSRVVASFLRDAGFDVVYTSPWQEIAAVVRIALQEDVDIIGISTLATDHLIVPKLMLALREAGLGGVPVVVGGIVPDDEVSALIGSGVARVFGPGASREEIEATFRQLALERREHTAHTETSR